MFFAGKVFLVNFSFSFPRIPRVASLPFFWVFVVKEKTKISLKILAEILYTVWLYLLRGACTFSFALVWVFVVKDKTKISLKILAEILYTVWLYLLRGADTFLFALVLNSKIFPIIPRPFACKGGGKKLPLVSP